MLGHTLVPIRSTARVIRRFQNNIFAAPGVNMAESLRVHSLIARAATHSRASCPLADRQGGATLARLREGGRGGRGGEGRGGEGRGGEGRGGEGRGGEGRGGEGRGGEGRGGEDRGGQGRAGEGRGGDCPHFPQTRTFVTAEPSRPPAKRVTG